MILTGDCRDILPTLGAESVDCCVTSPPYALGLRNYGDFPNQIGQEATLEEYIETITDFVEAQTDYLNHIRKSKRALKRRERLTWKPINRTS